MKLVDSFLEELTREAERSRRVLANVPLGQDEWKPHAKSMSLAALAGLVAAMPSWITYIIEMEELDINPPEGQGQYQPPPMDKLVETHDGHVEKARASLSGTTDQFLETTNWRLRAGGPVVMDLPRHIVLRDTFNHLAHHRGQLTVYLRLLGQPVPSVYGPSADDQHFG